MISFFKSDRKPKRSERLLWICFALISLQPVSALLFEEPGNFFTDFRTAFSAIFTGIAIFGLLFNWGPLVPSTVFGVVVAILLTDPVSSSHEEAAFKVFGNPLIGATLGVIFGLIFDRMLTLQSLVKLKPDELEVVKSTEFLI